MTTKLVCRLLDAGGTLLGWTEVQARAKGDGQLWSRGPVSVVVTESGYTHSLSVHWCDVNVETVLPVVHMHVVPGQPVMLYASATPMIRVGTPPALLPPVTVGEAVKVLVPVGGVGARGIVR